MNQLHFEIKIFGLNKKVSLIFTFYFLNKFTFIKLFVNNKQQEIRLDGFY